MFSNSTNKNRNIRTDFKIFAQDNLLCRIEGQDQELAKGGEDEVFKLKQSIFDDDFTSRTYLCQFWTQLFGILVLFRAFFDYILVTLPSWKELDQEKLEGNIKFFFFLKWGEGDKYV